MIHIHSYNKIANTEILLVRSINSFNAKNRHCYVQNSASINKPSNYPLYKYQLYKHDNQLTVIMILDTWNLGRFKLCNRKQISFSKNVCSEQIIIFPLNKQPLQRLLDGGVEAKAVICRGFIVIWTFIFIYEWIGSWNRVFEGMEVLFLAFKPRWYYFTKRFTLKSVEHFRRNLSLILHTKLSIGGSGWLIHKLVDTWYKKV